VAPELQELLLQQQQQQQQQVQVQQSDWGSSMVAAQ
jgi:hypothetical protein